MKPQAWRLAIARAGGAHEVPTWVRPVALALSTHSSADGLCTASIAELVESSGSSKAAVCRQLAWLLEHGWIRVGPRVHPSGRRLASARILTDPRGPEPVDNKQQREGGTVPPARQGTVPPARQTDCPASETAVLGREVLRGSSGHGLAVDSLVRALAQQKRIPR